MSNRPGFCDGCHSCIEPCTPAGTNTAITPLIIPNQVPKFYITPSEYSSDGTYYLICSFKDSDLQKVREALVSAINGIDMRVAIKQTLDNKELEL